MSIPFGFDSVEEIANLALFTRAKQKKAEMTGMIIHSNYLTIQKASAKGQGFFEQDNNSGLLRRIAPKDSLTAAVKYSQLTPLNKANKSRELRVKYLRALGYTARDAIERVSWGTVANGGFITSDSGLYSLIHSRGATAMANRLRKQYAFRVAP